MQYEFEGYESWLLLLHDVVTLHLHMNLLESGSPGFLIAYYLVLLAELAIHT